MTWYYTVRGGHTHVAVFLNGGKCGDLCFRNEEFEHIQRQLDQGLRYGYTIEFVENVSGNKTPDGIIAAMMEARKDVGSTNHDQTAR
jgi:hypothetical protein